MLTTISWKEYSIVLAVITVCYYILVAWLYYKKEILRLVGIIMSEPDTIPAETMQQFKDSLKDNKGYLLKEDNDLMLLPFKDELTAYFEAQDKTTEKKKLTFGVASVLSKYPNLHNLSLQTQINQLILSAINHNGISNLDEEDIEAIWKQVG